MAYYDDQYNWIDDGDEFGVNDIWNGLNRKTEPAVVLPPYIVNEKPIGSGSSIFDIALSNLNLGSTPRSVSGSNIFADPTTIAASPVYTNRSYGAGGEAMDKIANEALDRINKARVAAGYPPHTVQSASNAGIEVQINNEVKSALEAIAEQEDAAALLAARNNPTVNPLAAAANAALGVGTSIFNGLGVLATDPGKGVTNIVNNVGSAITGGGQSGMILPIPGIGGAAAAIATGAILANPQAGAAGAAAGAAAGGAAAGAGTTPGQTTTNTPVVIGSGALGGAAGSGEATTNTTAVTTGSLGGAVTTPPATTTTTTSAGELSQEERQRIMNQVLSTVGKGETPEQQNARITGIVQAGINQVQGDPSTSTATKTTIFTGVPQRIDTKNQACGIGYERKTPDSDCTLIAPVTSTATTCQTGYERKTPDSECTLIPVNPGDCAQGYRRETPNGPCVLIPITSTATTTATSTFTHLPWIIPASTTTTVPYEPNTIKAVERNVGTEGGETSSALAALRNQLVSLYGSAASGYSDADLTNYLNMQRGLSGANAENTRQAAQQTRDANRLLRENNLQDVENNYQKALGLRKDANQGLYSSLDQYTQQAQAQSAADQARIAQAGVLSREDTRDAQQAAREAWAARGMVNSEGAVGSEILNRDALIRQRQNEARAYGQQSSANLYNAVGANTANVFDPMNAILGQQYGMQTNNMGSNAQLFNQGAALSSGALGNQYAQNVFNPFSTYSNDVYGTNINAYYADEIAKRNNAAAIEGARLSGQYNLAGTALTNANQIGSIIGKLWDMVPKGK